MIPGALSMYSKKGKTTTNFPVSSDRVLTCPYVCTRGEAWIELNTLEVFTTSM